jgi:DAACS family dicarboxylate/amino acid:cation (Na+ or H+) symporter
MKNPWRWPLYVRVLLGVVLGTLVGVQFGTEPFLGGLSTRHLGQLGLLVIRLLTALATPLILFAILDAFARTHISGRLGIKMVIICLVNIAFAFVVGLMIMNLWQPGLRWRGELEVLSKAVLAGKASGQEPGASLSPLEILSSYTPKNVVQPFLDNNVLSVVLLAVLAGVAFRQVRRRQQAEGETSYQAVEGLIVTGYEMTLRMLGWLVEIVPLAVFGAVALVVGESGFSVFALLWVFVAAMLLGLAIHSLLYYPLSAWLVGRKSPRLYLAGGADAVLTGLSTNSSLASVPVTLECLTERMGVSQASARLSACVGTNFNNDGITLYEAMSVLFVAQAAGYDLSIPQQIGVLLTALFASVGMAGIPGSGMIILPLVLRASGLPMDVILVAYPLLQSVDWIIARIRSGVNVMGDMQVAILLDAGRPADEPNVAAALPLDTADVSYTGEEAIM